MSEPLSRRELLRQLQALGIRRGDLLMVHASLKAIGPVEGGAAEVVEALRDAIGSTGTLLAYGSWDRSPYEETLNGRELPPDLQDAWPAFDPLTARTYPGFGLLNEFLRQVPGARRSPHPDASMIAVGPLAAELVDEHPLGHAFGAGSPLERFVNRDGRVLLLGAPLDAVTVLHYAEAMAAIPNKRRVSYAMPLLDRSGAKVWIRAEDYDSNGILDVFANGAVDAVESIARAYVSERRLPEGRVGLARCRLFDARDLVAFGIRWLESRFGPPST